MTVKELIEKLRDEDPDAEVHFAYSYGDHWRTTVAPKVRRVEEAEVVHSAYHRMDKVVEEDSDEEQETRSVVVLAQGY